jgi:hypothetical protein
MVPMGGPPAPAGNCSIESAWYKQDSESSEDYEIFRNGQPVTVL